MEDRLEALGGRLEITSTVGSGTTLRATIPLARATISAALAGVSPAERGAAAGAVPANHDGAKTRRD